MHARVEGRTPAGETYRALDADLLDWVSATAGYGFLTAYDRFVAPLSEADKRRFYAEGEAVARLYGVTQPVFSDADFAAMCDRLLPRFEPHPVVGEFLAIIESGRGAPGLPRALHRALARASVSLLPPAVRTRLDLGPQWTLGPFERAALRTAGALADRIPVGAAPPAQACVRLGLPRDFLYRPQAAQRRMLARRRMASAEPAVTAAE
jgi:uncharacterized protein (DUF2236 family)